MPETGMPEADLAGTAIKSGVSLTTGLLQNLQAKKLKNAANSLFPQGVDPRQAAFLSELNQKRRSMDTGADFAAGMNAIDTGNAGTNQAITQNTGGDVGGTIQGLLQSERVSADAKNNVLAQGQGQQMQLNSMFNDLNNKIAARQLQLQMQKSQQARAEWAQKQQTANQNINAGISNLTGMLPGSGTGPTMGGNPTGQGMDRATQMPDTSFLNSMGGKQGASSAEAGSSLSSTPPTAELPALL